MGFNAGAYWLAILALALGGAQFGFANLSARTFSDIFKREPSKRMLHVMRTLPKFLAVMSIISLCLALLAGIELIWGFGGDLGIAIANHLHVLNNKGWT